MQILKLKQFQGTQKTFLQSANPENHANKGNTSYPQCEKADYLVGQGFQVNLDRALYPMHLKPAIACKRREELKIYQARQ